MSVYNIQPQNITIIEKLDEIIDGLRFTYFIR
jgi:hypothetical protein